MHMKEHPDYKYKPRRKPKHLMKKDRYPFPMPYIQAPMDYLGFHAAAASHARSLFPPLTPSLGLNPFNDTYFPSIETSRAHGHEHSLLDQALMASQHHNHHSIGETKLGLSGGFDVKSLLLAGGHNHCQSNASANHSMSCTSPYIPCGCGFHTPAPTPAIGLQSFGSLAQTTSAASTIPSTSQSNSLSLHRSLTKLHHSSNQRVDERNKSHSESPSPLGFRINHPTTALSNNSSASSS
ncbi:unnamed protein product, partial [Medioppia subpectinata]